MVYTTKTIDQMSQSTISAIWFVNRTLATVIFISTMFLFLANLCCWYLVQDSFMDYLLCVLFNECVAGHNERMTHKNSHTSFVWFSREWGQASRLFDHLLTSVKIFELLNVFLFLRNFLTIKSSEEFKGDV